MAERRAPSPVLRQIWQRAAWQRLREAVEVAFGGPPDGVQMCPEVVRGEPGEVLVRIARGPDDLIVVGAGRRGVPGRIIHGRVARYCVAHATCPVVAVPPSELAGYTRRWRGALAFRHNRLTAAEALDVDGADWDGA
jgi:hypothetical protein